MSSTSPDAASMALVHEGWDHLRARRPLAARASWQRAVRLGDDTSAAAQAIATLGIGRRPARGGADRLPAPPAGRRRRRGAWDDRLRGLAGGGAGSGGGLGDANLAAMADAFGRLAAEGPPDPAAWYNRALCLAWLGSNREAVTCLEHVVELEADPAPDRAVEAWTLAELLRQGGGAEDLADDLRYACTIDWDPGDTASLLDEFPEIHRVPTPQAPGIEPGTDLAVEVFEWPDRPIPAADDAGLERHATAAGLPVVLASVMVDRSSRTLRLSSPRVETLQQAEERLLSRLGTWAGGPIRPRREASPLPLPFLDADVWTVRMPGGLEPSRAEEWQREWVEHYYENLWIHRPRQGLGGLSPMAAAEAAHRGDAVIRAKLMAVVDFREQLARRPSAQRLYQGYPFDRLRRRLGLAAGRPRRDRGRPRGPLVRRPLGAGRARPEGARRPPAGRRGRLGRRAARRRGHGAARGRAVPPDRPDRGCAPGRRGLSAGAAGDGLRRSRRGARLDRPRPTPGRRPDRRDPRPLARRDPRAPTGPTRPCEPIAALIGSDAKGAAMALDAAETLIDNRHFDQARPLLDAARDLAQVERPPLDRPPGPGAARRAGLNTTRRARLRPGRHRRGGPRVRGMGGAGRLAPDDRLARPGRDRSTVSENP